MTINPMVIRVRSCHRNATFSFLKISHFLEFRALWISSSSFIVFDTKLANWCRRTWFSVLSLVERHSILTISWSWLTTLASIDWFMLSSSDVNLPKCLKWANFVWGIIISKKTKDLHLTEHIAGKLASISHTAIFFDNYFEMPHFYGLFNQMNSCVLGFSLLIAIPIER